MGLVTGAARTLERLWAWASGACGAGAVLRPLCPQQPPPNTTGQRGLWGPAAAPDTVCHQPQACSQHSATPDLRSVADAPSPPLLQKPGARVSVLDPSGSVLTALRPRTTRSPARSPLVLSSAGPFPPGRLEPAVVGARALLRGPSPCHRLPQFHPCHCLRPPYHPTSPRPRDLPAFDPATTLCSRHPPSRLRRLPSRALLSALAVLPLASETSAVLGCAISVHTSSLPHQSKPMTPKFTSAAGDHR